MTNEEFDKYVVQSYGRFPISLHRAEGNYVYSKDKKYLDFMSGWGVSNLGHTHPAVIKAVNHQLDTLIHVPNVFYTDAQGELAKKLVESSFESQVFFSNSGAEANEAAIKFAKLYGSSSDRHEIITFNKSFHGRTSATMAATAQESIHPVVFAPHLRGFRYVDFNDSEALESAVNDKTVAVMLEFVQGEGGINIASPEFISTISRLQKEHDLLVIADEVQTGLGRTGRLFAYQNYDIIPDIMTLAKALAGGFPIGATLISPKISQYIKPGMHGSTFGGGAAVCEAAKAVLDETNKIISASAFRNLITLFSAKLQQIKSYSPHIVEVRQLGLMIAIELDIPATDIVKHCLDSGLVINVTQANIIRLLPPLTSIPEEVEFAFTTIKSAIDLQAL